MEIHLKLDAYRPNFNFAFQKLFFIKLKLAHKTTNLWIYIQIYKMSDFFGGEERSVDKEYSTSLLKLHLNLDINHLIEALSSVYLLDNNVAGESSEFLFSYEIIADDTHNAIIIVSNYLLLNIFPVNFLVVPLYEQMQVLVIDIKAALSASNRTTASNNGVPKLMNICKVVKAKLMSQDKIRMYSGPKILVSTGISFLINHYLLYRCAGMYESISLKDSFQDGICLAAVQPSYDFESDGLSKRKRDVLILSNVSIMDSAIYINIKLVSVKLFELETNVIQAVDISNFDNDSDNHDAMPVTININTKTGGNVCKLIYMVAS